MKTPDVVALANASRALLAQGDAVGAERVLAPVFNQLRADHTVLHLMGLIKRSLDQLEEAERHLRSAIAYSFNEGGYYNDLGVVLQARGAYDEAMRVYRAALALTPQAVAVRVNMVRCLMAAGDLADAENEARAYIEATPGPEAWTLLGQVQRAQDRYEDAVTSAANALKYQPRMRGLLLNHATALDRAGRYKEALDIYSRLATQELDTPELALNLARALYLDGRKKDSESVLEEAVAAWPGSVTLHSTLARARWLRGEGENATAIAEAEIERRPKDIALRLACADAMHRGQHHQKALRILDEASRVAPDTPALLTALGIVLDELDRPRDGLKALRRVTELTPKAAHAWRNLLSTLIRAGQADEALRIVRELRTHDPDEQYLIACEALAMRVLGMPGYRQLYDYDRLVRTYQIEPPRGFFTLENFNAALADVLRRQHRVDAHPFDQHIPHGSQTSRSLLTLNDKPLKAFIGAIDSAVRDYISRFSAEEGDAVGRRRGERYRYTGFWSVRQSDGGFQPNHVHDRGWISSAYFVASTPNEKLKDPHAGWLKLGEPNRPVMHCTPEKWIEPKPGLLVLFPSYIWHGTAAFEGAERLSAVFEVTPA